MSVSCDHVRGWCNEGTRQNCCGRKRLIDLNQESYMAKKRTGILTGGGDVPGLNSVIKSVVYRGAELGCEVIGIRRGWEGLTHLDLNDPASEARCLLPLNRENTRTIDRTGGTIL